MDPDIADILGWVDTRTREDRQMDQLRDRLRMRFWRRNDAVIILSGLDPESPSIEDRGWSLLPGTTYAVESWEMDERLEDAGSLDLKVKMPPGEIIALAYQHNIEIPWLEIAAADLQCVLPAWIRSAVLQRLAKRRRAAAGIKARNEQTSLRHADARKPLVAEANKHLALLCAQGKAPFKQDGSLIVSTLYRELERIAPRLGFTERTLRNWVAVGLVRIESAK